METFERERCDFDGVDITVAVDKANEDNESSEGSRSALRKNCRGVKGAPIDGVDGKASDRLPSGVEKAKEGRCFIADSGDCGLFEASFSSAACKIDALIHFSSLGPVLGGDSGIRRNRSAK